MTKSRKIEKFNGKLLRCFVEKKHHEDWFLDQIIEKQGIGLRWLFSTLWAQGFSKDGFNWNSVLSKKNRKLLLLNPRNQSYRNMDISVQKQNFYLNIDSVLRKKYMKTIMVVKPQRLMIWSRITEFPKEKNLLFRHFENKTSTQVICLNFSSSNECTLAKDTNRRNKSQAGKQ